MLALINRALHAAAATWMVWREVHRTVIELNALRDSQLADLGIVRREIPTVARRAVLAH